MIYVAGGGGAEGEQNNGMWQRVVFSPCRREEVKYVTVCFAQTYLLVNGCMVWLETVYVMLEVEPPERHAQRGKAT